MEFPTSAIMEFPSGTGLRQGQIESGPQPTPGG